ncbi:MAG: hypothetical protein ABIH11_00255, partial [Candidatus Altiarchaeota archaeon]
YLNISLAAVPLFILIHLYLFIIKNDSLAYSIKSSKRLLTLYILYGLLQTIVHVVQAVLLHTPLQEFRDIPRILWLGGPSLPFVGHPVFYFFSVLIALTIFTALFFNKKSTSRNRKLYLVSAFLMILIMLAYAEYRDTTGVSFKYYRIENFLVYVPLAYLLVEHKKYFERYRSLVLAAALLLFMRDSMRPLNILTANMYMRSSLVFISLTFFLYKPSIHRLIGRLNPIFGITLGIYALHKYFQFIVLYALSTFPIPKLTALGLVLASKNIITSIIAIPLTVLVVHLMSKTRLERLV